MFMPKYILTLHDCLVSLTTCWRSFNFPILKTFVQPARYEYISSLKQKLITVCSLPPYAISITYLFPYRGDSGSTYVNLAFVMKREVR